MIALVPLVLTLSASPEPATTGRYVEARTASVFAGACHYNGELMTRGREAVLAWSFETGDLAGARAVAIVTAEKNLSFAEAKRQSILHVADDLAPERREALVRLLRARYVAVLGEVKCVKASPVRVAFDGDAYDVEVPGVARLVGRAMPDRACCTMPTHVWYEPFVELERPLVGNSRLFAYTGKELEAKWSCRGDNDAFVGTFRIAN